MIIDCHAHFIPRELVTTLAEGRLFPDISVQEGDEGLSFKFPGLPQSPLAPATITDSGAFAEWHQGHGIDVQILSPWTDLFGYTLAPDDGVRWCRFLNEAIAAVAAERPSLWAIGAVPLQDPAASAEGLRHVRELGLRGVMIGSELGLHAFDSAPLDEFWAAAAELHVPVYVHPIFVQDHPELVGLGLPNAIGRANSTHVALARYLLGGVGLRHPDLQLVVSHGGAGLPYLLGRLERSHELDPEHTHSPREGFRRLLLDTVVLDPTALSTLLRFASPHQVLLGSDFPFPWEPTPLETVHKAGLDADVVEAVVSGNPVRIFDPENN